MFLATMAKANRAQRREVARALGLKVRDVRVVDASVVTLPKRAQAVYPSTDAQHGGFKLTATLSVLQDLLITTHVTDARQHDRKAFTLPEDVRGILWIKDRGYSDHNLFAQIDDGKGFFLIRIKTSSLPIVSAIRSGLAGRHLGKPLDRSLAFGVVDIDARFNVKGGTRVFRIVGIPVAKNKKGEPDWIWLATNLPTTMAAKTVGVAYRLRWNVENLFRVLKTVGRLDHIRSANPAIVQVFIAASLVGLALSQAICAAMRIERPRCEPSLHRVFALVLVNLGGLLAAAASRGLAAALVPFVAALWREGVNPNPGRPYAARRHLATVGA
jgi:hypothetical protein